MFKIFANDIGIDLGTSNTRVCLEDQGIIIDEPSVVALDINTYEILAVGNEAREMMGKTPDNIIAIRPIEEGVISDFESTQGMLAYFIKKANNGFSLFQPRVIITLPSGLTDVERRAVEDAALHAGSREVVLIDKALASAIGADLPVYEPKGSMIVNAGGGTVEVAVVSLGGIVSCKSVKVGGEALDGQIINLVKKKYNLMVGANTAEKIKIELATFLPLPQPNKLEISGRDMVTGMPKKIEVTSDDIQDLVCDYGNAIVDAIRSTLEKTPPELAADVSKSGIFLCGGSMLIEGFPEFIRNEIGIETTLIENPMDTACIGCGKVIAKPDNFKKGN